MQSHVDRLRQRAEFLHVCQELVVAAISISSSTIGFLLLLLPRLRRH